MCTFDNIILGGLYQICTCKRHLWSIRANCVITLNEKGFCLLSDIHGTRFKFYPTQYEIEDKTERQITSKTLVFCLLVSLLTFAFITFANDFHSLNM